MAYLEERAMAEQAMRAGDGEAHQFPPTAARFRAALQRAGISAHELAVRCGAGGTLYQDLELDDSEVFDCVNLTELPRIAALLRLPLLELLFGEQPQQRVVPVSYAEVSEAVRQEANRQKIGLEALGESVGWSLEELIRDPDAVGKLNLTGLYDICRAVGVDWVSVLAWAEERGRRTRR